MLKHPKNTKLWTVFSWNWGDIMNIQPYICFESNLSFFVRTTERKCVVIVLETIPGANYKPEVLLRDWRCQARARVGGGTSKEAGSRGRIRMDWAQGIRHNLQTRWNSTTHSESHGRSVKSTLKFIRTRSISNLTANYFLLALKWLEYFQWKVCTTLKWKFIFIF